MDFEASEARQQIISIGCVTESGREFYSLVYTDDPITFRIEEITGISQEDVDNAPNSSEVFERFYDWCNEDKEMPEFVCYGSSDPEFVYNNYLEATTLKEAAMLSYMYVNLYDCSEEMKEHFYVNKTISLEKLGQYYDHDMGAQTHNALDDARLLKMVSEKMKEGKKENNVFNEYFDTRRMPSEVKKVLAMHGDVIHREFNSMAEAVAWVKNQPNDKGPSYLKDADEKIKKAAQSGGKYFNCNWRIL